MARLAETPTPRELLDHLVAVISSRRFQTSADSGNEVPFFICPYAVQDAVAINAMRANLVNQLATQGVRVLEINLYDLSVEMLRERQVWDDAIAIEPNSSKAELLELLQGVLDPENHLIPEIGERLKRTEFDVLFLSGVGEVYPFIRSHNVLNNLQSTAKEKPTLMFFPGKYTFSAAKGASLDLFGTLHDDKYYRAFNIMHYEI